LQERNFRKVDQQVKGILARSGDRLNRILEDLERLSRDTSALRSILNNLSEGVIVVDREGRFLFFNPAAERILGIGSLDITPDLWADVYGCYLSDKVTPYPANELPLARAMSGEDVQDEVLFIRNAQQPLGVWISTTSHPLLDKTGQINGGVLTLRDVTELHFRDEAERLARAVEQTADSVVISNKDGIIEYVNPAFESTTGFREEEAIGNTPSILKSGYHDAEFYKELWGKLLKGEPFRGTILNKKKNGELYWSEQTISPIKDQDGNITNFVSVLKDITELKAKHEQDLQLGIARKIQQEFYPSEISVPGFDIAGAAYPANETGGDYFDYIMTSDGFLWILVGDVGGHGIGAALIMAETRAYIRSNVRNLTSPGEVLTRVNQELTVVGEGERFVTMLLAQIDPRHHTLRFANAGHVPGYLLNDAGQIILEMKFGDLPLGVLQEYEYASSEHTSLKPGYIAAFLTDGITEAMNFDGQDFGGPRVVEAIQQQRLQSSAVIVDHLYQSVHAFTHNQVQEDDITMVICKMLGEGTR
jgi:sigma-B regulation protein RsbU (phosphoserine phosphatase)